MADETSGSGGGKADMTDIFEKMFALGVGVFALTKEKVEATVNELVERGRISQSEGKDLVADLTERGMKQKDDFTSFMRTEFRKMLDRADVATKADVERLEAEINALRAEVLGAAKPVTEDIAESEL